MQLRYQYKPLDVVVYQTVDEQSRYRVSEGQAICDKVAMRWCDDAIAISHRGIGSGEFIGENKQRYVNTAICDCDIASEDSIRETKQRGRSILRLAIAISHRRRSNGAISDRRRVLTKFQINLVIPKKQYLWLYFKQGGDMYLDFYK